MKTVVICGGSKGIGAATTKEFLSQGMKVICLSRTVGDLVTAPNLVHYSCDLSNPHERIKICDVLRTEDIWALVNNASGPATGSIEKTATEEYIKAFQTHLFASDDLVKAVLPSMKKNNSGRIVNIISVTARIPLENMGVSNTLRGAMLNWSKTLSKEIGKFNITVNNVLPGYTETQRLGEVIKGVSEKLGISEKEYSQKILDQVPMRRFATPEEISNVIKFLVSEEASFVNGVSIPVDGGWTPCP